mmetsp:Transcript_51998/g.123798  ORF Transcript_51998/g.123798 Transcript_51998/m.123798 type:complete len:244 (-) Transcript_51998:33-764(-)
MRLGRPSRHIPAAHRDPKRITNSASGLKLLHCGHAQRPPASLSYCTHTSCWPRGAPRSSALHIIILSKANAHGGGFRPFACEAHELCRWEGVPPASLARMRDELPIAITALRWLRPAHDAKVVLVSGKHLVSLRHGPQRVLHPSSSMQLLMMIRLTDMPRPHLDVADVVRMPLKLSQRAFGKKRGGHCHAGDRGWHFVGGGSALCTPPNEAAAETEATRRELRRVLLSSRQSCFGILDLQAKT